MALRCWSSDDAERFALLQYHQIACPSFTSSIMNSLGLLSPTPLRPPPKRSFLDAFETPIEQASRTRYKRRRPGSSILSWLSTVSSDYRPQESRPLSAPATFDNAKISGSLEIVPASAGFLADMDDMDSIQSKNDKDTASQTTNKSNVTTIKPSSSKYRSVLEYNHVEIDPTGLKMSPDIKDLVDKHILKQRSSPPLSQDILNNTVTSMNQWGSSTENVVNNFMSSAMFPVTRPNLGHGGNSPWPRAALPYDPDYGYGISAPKPDYHIGYAVGKKSGFSARQAHVLDHPQAQKYTQPGTGNILPFITVELKSEATGGTLFHAENQAAGSGTYSVRAMEWLLDQAKAESKPVDSVAFSIAATGRLVVLSIHWFSPEDKTYYMSYVKSFTTTDKEHVQACHSTVKNIVDWAVDDRHDKLKTTLQTLFPYTNQWSKRSSFAAELEDENNKVDYPEEDTASQSQRSLKSRSRSRTKLKTGTSTPRSSSFTSIYSSQARQSSMTKYTSASIDPSSLKDPPLD